MEEINIGLRQEQLRHLQEYVKDIDKDITLILQSLQWDRKHLQQNEKKVTCKYDSNHRIPADKVKEHEEKCYLKSQNYVPGELFFPEPLDANAVTVVKLSAENINDIINYAIKTDPSLKRKGSESGIPGQAPLTLGHLQAAYSVDERRALYDAVAAAAPPPAPLGRDLANDGATTTGTRESSRDDALLALRDARRRRARHRGAARDTYQHELRGLISAQMESVTGKWNDEDTDTKPDVTVDESDDGPRCGRESDRRDRVRNDGRSKYLNPNRREHGESREPRKKEYRRENREVQRREYERGSRDDKKREYEREGREDKRRVYEYDKKYKETNKICELSDRKRPRRYEKEYLEIKQEKDDYPAERRKREERRYDYKNRKEETDRSSSRDNKKYHKREELHHKQKSTERRRGRSRDREHDRSNKSDINCSYLKIKTEPPDYK